MWTSSTEAGPASFAPALGGTIASAMPLTSTNVHDYVLIDGTTAVGEWLNGSQSNDGIVLVANSPLSATFDSKENSTQSHPAELDVVFTSGGTLTGVTTASGWRPLNSFLTDNNETRMGRLRGIFCSLRKILHRFSRFCLELELPPQVLYSRNHAMSAALRIQLMLLARKNHFGKNQILPTQPALAVNIGYIRQAQFISSRRLLLALGTLPLNENWTGSISQILFSVPTKFPTDFRLPN